MPVTRMFFGCHAIDFSVNSGGTLRFTVEVAQTRHFPALARVNLHFYST